MTDSLLKYAELFLIVLMLTLMYLIGWVEQWPGFQNHWLDSELGDHIATVLTPNNPFIYHRKNGILYAEPNPHFDPKKPF